MVEAYREDMVNYILTSDKMKNLTVDAIVQNEEAHLLYKVDQCWLFDNWGALYTACVGTSLNEKEDCCVPYSLSLELNLIKEK